MPIICARHESVSFDIPLSSVRISENAVVFTEIHVYAQLKVHFVIHNLIPSFISKKVQIFTPVEAFRYKMLLCKIFCANSFV